MHLDNGHLDKPKPLRGDNPCVTCNHAPAPINQDGHQKSELLDAGGELLDLLLRVSTRIRRVENQFLYAPIADLNLDRPQIVGDRGRFLWGDINGQRLHEFAFAQIGP